MRARLYRGLAYAVACQLKKPQMQQAVVAVFSATLDRFVDDTITKLQTLERRIRGHDIIDAEYEMYEK